MRLYGPSLRGAKRKSTSVIPTPSAFYRHEESLPPSATVDCGFDAERTGFSDPLPQDRERDPPLQAVHASFRTDKERNKLVKFGSNLGKALGELVTIVHPNTLRRQKRTKRAKSQRGKRIEMSSPCRRSSADSDSADCSSTIRRRPRDRTS